MFVLFLSDSVSAWAEVSILYSTKESTALPWLWAKLLFKHRGAGLEKSGLRRCRTFPVVSRFMP